jgi:putative oxidoreductase
MTDDRLRSYGVFLLRVALGTMFLAHSTIYMLMTLTLVGTAKFFVSIGLPAWLAYATFLVEAVGGILLILCIAQALLGDGAYALAPSRLGTGGASPRATAEAR